MTGRGKEARDSERWSEASGKVLRDNIQGITKPAIRRLARRGGVKRISSHPKHRRRRLPPPRRRTEGYRGRWRRRCRQAEGKPTHRRLRDGQQRDQGAEGAQRFFSAGHQRNIAAQYKVDAEKHAPFIRKYRKAQSDPELIQTKGKGASGSFKLESKSSSGSKKSSGGSGGGGRSSGVANSAAASPLPAPRQSKTRPPRRFSTTNQSADPKEKKAAAAAAALRLPPPFLKKPAIPPQRRQTAKAKNGVAPRRKEDRQTAD
ncbi:Histone H1-III [Eumeta japonica]|uniref:Histone H4 n=1 Tax=Eumeta variegata TaxID=151549 RepID=A0A4C1ZTW1_EUMVA|nr:Histone H1-III [Eumeta japonica]